MHTFVFSNLLVHVHYNCVVVLQQDAIVLY